MTKLSDTQAIILSAAAQRDDRNVLPLPGSLRGGAATKVVGAMIAKGFLEEVEADMRRGEPVWRETGDGHGTTLIATDAGLAAIGIEPEGADTAPAGALGSPTEEPAPDAHTEPESAPKARTPREGTKQATLIAMLRAPEGATIDEIATALEWAGHTDGQGCNGRSVEKEARARGHLGKGRRARKDLSASACLNAEAPNRMPLPFGAAVYVRAQP